MLSEGFPELVGVKDKQVVKKYLRESIVEKVIFRDLSVLLAIRNVASLESLLNILMEEPGQLVEISELAGQLRISRQTLSDYLYYLEQSFLVRKLYNYSTGRRKVERKLRKYYPTVASVDMLYRDDDMSRSRVLETVCVNQLKAEFFWRDKYKNEVDIVLTNNKPIPIEVKHGKPDLTGLNVFMKKFSIKKGYIVSRDIEEKREVDGKEIVIVPAYKYFLTQTVKI